MTDEEIENGIELYEEMNEKIADILAFGDKPEQYAAKYIKSLRAENERLKTEIAILKKDADEAFQQGLNEMKELVAPEIRKETAKEILSMIKEASSIKDGMSYCFPEMIVASKIREKYDVEVD